MLKILEDYRRKVQYELNEIKDCANVLKTYKISAVHAERIKKRIHNIELFNDQFTLLIEKINKTHNS